ncbi:hypothetical protein GOQ29_14405 [Clostridium sp. D2Q-14]|uniref:hypothetical protein n=1 Tax=Anaeromonas gelatinilytica TaxID=2683194 RepID=UPI00193B4817|nr:hypothetical protein [Anaeromonas gelatinilytica]MBS4536809.1 hypothetical protein [Anaeromonas gelatinilytica]
MWKKIYDKLKEKGLNPYPPGKHLGECIERYCVIKENSQVPYFNSNKTGYKIIDIIVLVPDNSYISISPYMKEIKAAMKELNFIRKTGNETPVITDDSKKAYTLSIEYQLMKKLEG